MRAALLALICVACAQPEREPEPEPPPIDPVVLDAIDLSLIRGHVDIIAGDATGGRPPGSPGHHAAVDYAVDHLRDAGWHPASGDDFVIEQPLRLSRARYMFDADGEVVPVPREVAGRQVMAVLPGTDDAVSDEYVVLMAHLDHLGVTEDGEVYNGAFDDGTAVAALLELARVLGESTVRFRRPLLVFFTDAEEDGLTGIRTWTGAPTLPLDDLVAVISVDPIGRGILPDVAPLAAIGTERSPALRDAVARAEVATGSQVAEINRTQMLGFASDQDAFWELDDPVPAVWIASGGMTWYHTVDDDPETIDYRTVRAHLPIIAQLAGALADADDRPVDLGTQALSLADAAECVDFGEVLLGSTVLTDSERDEIAAFATACQGALDLGDPTDSGFRAGYIAMLATAVLALPEAHPGEVPPPFPGE